MILHNNVNTLNNIALTPWIPNITPSSDTKKLVNGVGIFKIIFHFQCSYWNALRIYWQWWSSANYILCHPWPNVFPANNFNPIGIVHDCIHLRKNLCIMMCGIVTATIFAGILYAFDTPGNQLFWMYTAYAQFKNFPQ